MEQKRKLQPRDELGLRPDNARPDTANIRAQMMEDDELLARALAFEDDEKIAQKYIYNFISLYIRRLQADYESGIAVDDFHRPPSSRRPTRSARGHQKAQIQVYERDMIQNVDHERAGILERAQVSIAHQAH